MEPGATSPKSDKSRESLGLDKPDGNKPDESPSEASYDSTESYVRGEYPNPPKVEDIENLYKTLGGRRLFKKEDIQILDEQLDTFIQEFKRILDFQHPLDKTPEHDPHILQYSAISKFRDVFGAEYTFDIPYIGYLYCNQER